MRALFILFGLILASSAQGQNAYFVDKKGQKTIMRDDAIEVILIDKRLSYKQVGKTWNKYIQYKDLDYAKWGNYIFKVVRVKGKTERGFFLHAETKTHKLLSAAVTITSTRGSGFSSSYMIYEVLVVDSNYKILEDLKFKSIKSDAGDREQIGPLVRRYFSDCEGLIKQLDQTGESESEIKDFLEIPEYINCQ